MLGTEGEARLETRLESKQKKNEWQRSNYHAKCVELNERKPKIEIGHQEFEERKHTCTHCKKAFTNPRYLNTPLGKDFHSIFIQHLYALLILYTILLIGNQVCQKIDQQHPMFELTTHFQCSDKLKLHISNGNMKKALMQYLVES